VVDVIGFVRKADVLHLQAALGLLAKVEDGQRHVVFSREAFSTPEHDTHGTLVVENIHPWTSDQAQVP
jgi:hypothetical protein